MTAPLVIPLDGESAFVADEPRGRGALFESLLASSANDRWPNKKGAPKAAPRYFARTARRDGSLDAVADQGRSLNRIRRRARMSASPICGRSSARQRSSLALENHCLLPRRGGKLQRRPRCQNPKRAHPLRRKSRAAAHVAVGDRTSRKLLVAPCSIRMVRAQRLS